MTEMSRRFGDEDAFTAVGAIGEEKNETEELEHGYTEEELNMLDAAERSVSASSKNWRNWSVPLRNQGSTSIHTPTVAVLRAMSHRTISPVTLKKSSGEVTNGRKPSRADWVSAIPKRKKRPENNGRIPSPRYAWRKKNATGRTLSSNHPMPVRKVPYGIGTR